MKRSKQPILIKEVLKQGKDMEITDLVEKLRSASPQALKVIKDAW